MSYWHFIPAKIQERFATAIANATQGTSAEDGSLTIELKADRLYSADGQLLINGEEMDRLYQASTQVGLDGAAAFQYAMSNGLTVEPPSESDPADVALDVNINNVVHESEPVAPDQNPNPNPNH